MKKMLVLVVIVAILGGAWYSWSKQTNSAPDIKVESVTSKPNPSNATFQFEDGPITLKNGVADTDITAGSAIKTETTLTDTLAYGDVNKDGKNDTAVILMQDVGGSGLFVYLAVYVSGNVSYKGSNAVFLGDRISPKSISVGTNGDIKVTYLDRKSDEAMAAEPTILTSMTFVYRNGELEEK